MIKGHTAGGEKLCYQGSREKEPSRSVSILVTDPKRRFRVRQTWSSRHTLGKSSL